ncbi:hypothetical protein O181_087098 [Austropuccinia psidii MF-1]|uniref:Uncharacterized protein n=1 Tax=Austropuccinia psidii MF-1 TaxID=1389203 RepID=A0A9Q3P0K2_9BASI|nr:hypothetical protein [Austropuccinia psidii MF-1]
MQRHSRPHKPFAHHDLTYPLTISAGFEKGMNQEQRFATNDLLSKEASKPPPHIRLFKQEVPPEQHKCRDIKSMKTLALGTILNVLESRFGCRWETHSMFVNILLFN